MHLYHRYYNHDIVLPYVISWREVPDWRSTAIPAGAAVNLATDRVQRHILHDAVTLLPRRGYILPHSRWTMYTLST